MCLSFAVFTGNVKMTGNLQPQSTEFETYAHRQLQRLKGEVTKHTVSEDALAVGSPCQDPTGPTWVILTLPELPSADRGVEGIC